MIASSPRKAAVLFLRALLLCSLLTIPLTRLAANSFDTPAKLIETNHWKRTRCARLLPPQTTRKDKRDFPQAVLIVPPEGLAAGR
jgi:hypothetical protein